MTIRLITRADDAGSNASANQAILDTCNEGIIRNVSLMANGAMIEQAAELFRDRQDVCFGVHLTLNAEWDHVRWGAVSSPEQVQSLLDEQGFLYATPNLMKDKGALLDEVFVEMQAQLDRLSSLGFQISYADEHMFFGRVFAGFEARFEQWCKQEGLINHRKFQHRLPFQSKGPMTTENLIQTLEQSEDGTYVFVTHPAYDTPEMRELGHEGYSGEKVALERHNDTEMMTSEALKDYVERKEIVLLRYDEA